MSYTKKGYRIVFLATLIMGVYFEVVLFFYFQVRNISNLLLNDFRIVVALKKQSNVEDVKKKILENKWVKGIEYMSRDKILDDLEKTDNLLYLSIKSMALNPIPDIIKIEVDPVFLGNIDMIVDTLSKNDSITDIRYKPDEVVAIMHIEFYKRLLFLIIGITVALVFVILVSAVLYVGVGGVLSSFGESVKWFFDGVFGSLCGILSVYFIVYPTKYISQLWYWPEFYYNLCVLISGGVVGWVLYQWKKS
jgi:cell division protein FtsX